MTRIPRRLHPLLTHLAAALLVGVASAGHAQAPASATGVVRCGNSYGTADCPGGRAVQADDPRSDAQRQQAKVVTQQEARLARDLAAERQAREQAAIGQQAGRLGLTEAERAQAAKAAEPKKPVRKKPKKPGRVRAPKV